MTYKIYHFLVLSLEWKTTVHVSNHGDYLSRWSHLHVFSFSQAYTEGGEPLGTLETNQESLFETYLVFVKKPEGGVSADDLDSWYKSFLLATIPSSNHQERMVYSYRNVVTGFAAKLTAEEAKAVEDKDGFLSQSPKNTVFSTYNSQSKLLGVAKKFGETRLME